MIIPKTEKASPFATKLKGNEINIKENTMQHMHKQHSPGDMTDLTKVLYLSEFKNSEDVFARGCNSLCLQGF
jgi:hypothetical protein